MILLDNFVGANGTALASHAPDVGGPWVDDTAGFKIESNACTWTAGSPASHAPLNVKNFDARMMFDLNGMANLTELHLSLRDAAQTNYANIAMFGTGVIQSDVISVAGLRTQIVRTYPALTGIHQARILCTVSGITFFIDGAVMGTCPREALRTFVYPEVEINGVYAAGTFPIIHQLAISLPYDG